MVIRFNWSMYSVVVGFMRREDPLAKILRGGLAGASDNPNLTDWQSRKLGKDRQLCDDRLFLLAESLKVELRSHIWAAGIRKQTKQDLLLSLLHLLKSYTALTVLQAYPFRIAINNFIEKETDSRCSIHLSNEELLALWREVR